MSVMLYPCIFVCFSVNGSVYLVCCVNTCAFSLMIIYIIINI